MRTIGRLKELVNYNNGLDSLIAHKILLNYEQNKSIKPKVISQLCNVSVSTLTLFSKRLGYDGYSELYYRVMIEKEFYKTEKNIISNNKENNDPKILDLVNRIHNSEKIFFLKSEETSSVFIDFLISILSFEKKVVFTKRRKLEKYYVNFIDNKTLFIVFATGLEISELWNNIDLYMNYKINIFLITTEANRDLVKKYNLEDSSYFVEDQIKSKEFILRTMYRTHNIDELIIKVTEYYTKKFYKQ
ncbi:hypothetical protein [Mesoplasma corruscae]|uniref:HTH rpiR-type domain-containing protein n=1 Tax=Mesoplasma corruscae TaxID=216874 RepID=A0A2S5REA6_9MOLU|nr:hypothetical protein [Mesoplasma corruscae]PPE05640.1 hypothetical protein MCORR_v1c06670 [Mesoplasma corruscae]